MFLYDEDAIDEIVARACEDMLSMSKEGRKLFDSMTEAEQKTFIGKVKEIIANLMEWIDEFLSSYGTQSEEAKLLRNYKDKLEEISKIWDEMLVRSIEVNQALEKSSDKKAQKNTDTDDGVRYSDKSFEEQVEAMLSGEDTTSSHLKISEHTPKLLQELGLNDKPLLITSVHAKTALGYKVKGKNTHNVSKPVFKTLPQLIEDPAIAMESTKQGSIVMFVNAVDENKNPVVCSIKIDGRGFFNNVEIESNVVTSVYGKDTNPIGFIEKAVYENRLLYWNKKMSQELFDIPGLQLPDNIYNFDSNVIIRKIRAKINDKTVNNDDLQFSDKDDGANNRYYNYAENDFSKQIEDYLNPNPRLRKKPPTDSFLIGGTPQVLRDIGFNALPMTINKTHIDYALNGTKDFDHEVFIDVLKKIPEAIKSPVIVMESDSVSGRAVVVLKITAKNGKKLYAPIEIDGTAKNNGIRIDSNAIASLFGKGNVEDKIKKALNSEAQGNTSVFYWNKKEAISLLQRGGLQLPTRLPQDGFVHSIREKSSKIKVKLSDVTESLQFKRWFGDWQKNPKKASKVVDKDGKPLRMYHGTNVDEDFTVFDGYGGNFGLFGIGSYFTDNKSVAQSYTKKGKGNNPRVYEVYLNIKNPLDMDAKADKQKWIEAVDKQDRADFERYIANASTNEDVFKALKELCEDNEMYREEAYEYITNVIQNMKYDGITHIGGGRYGVDDGTRHRVYITFESEQVKSATDNIGTFDRANPNIQYSDKDEGVRNSDKITVDMSDDERYEILKNKVIVLAKTNTDLYNKYIQQMPKLLDEKLKKTDAKKLLKKIGNEFGVFAEYESKDFDISFDFGKNNLEESVNKQKGNYGLYAQMLSCFSDVISNAVGIEVHNRNEQGYKVDLTLKSVYVFCSAFENDTDIVPVKLSVKEFLDKENRLYVAVALESIKKDRVVSMGVQDNLTHIRTSPVTISIQDIFKNVNTKDGDFLKYIPDGFLSKEQKNAKQKALGVNMNLPEDVFVQYSDKDDSSVYDFMGEMERVRKEDEKLRADIERLRERLKLERQVTNGTIFKDSDVLGVARYLLKDANSSYDNIKLAKQLREVYSYIAKNKNFNSNALLAKLYEVADTIVAEGRPFTFENPEYARIMKAIRGNQTSLDRAL